MLRKHLCYLLCTLVLAGCASTQSEPQTELNDPLESVNRSVWDFNYDILDKHILRPTALAYQKYMPMPVRIGLVNMSSNLEAPSSMINNLLQAKPKEAATSAGRFLLNSTVGLLGLVDVAGYIGLKPEEEEFDEVLGKWGVSTGPYLMLPAYGPSVPRELAGDVVDSAYFPLDGLTIWLSAFRFGIDALESRIQVIPQEQLLEDSFDPYIFVKEAYFQNTQFKVYDGDPPRPKVEEAEEADFDAFLQGLE
ncbi:MlaA family lipoprotein [Catenovulum adriaticum]|uniref:VacJ family lipoprotein n=1 Tax=Catenovulum adriaticum TaxID=2984846 RepID=A0ABY7AKH5_9ALTE|nr:VacJ family lipoprotein [Catenovulum sp. TS8]WAJ69252.1 VacJ family lipoprotein [Catenovulum sp. TS8]